MTDTLKPSEEEQAIERIVRNQLEIKRLQDENETLKGFFKQSEAVYGAGTYKEVGKFYIRVTSNTRLDDSLAQAKLNSTRYRSITKTVLDTTKAKRYLTATELAAITKTFENRIEVGLR